MVSMSCRESLYAAEVFEESSVSFSVRRGRTLQKRPSSDKSCNLALQIPDAVMRRASPFFSELLRVATMPVMKKSERR